MSMRPWPRDPRNAGQGNLSIATHYMPVTLFLIFVSAVVFALTGLDDIRLWGAAKEGPGREKRDILLFSSEKHYHEYLAAYQDYKGLWDRLHQTSAHVPPSDWEQFEQSEARLKQYEAILKDPLADIKKGEIWRLVTPIFIHYGILHIVFNMMWLWQLGMLLEIRFRSLRFLALVILVAIVSNVSEALWSRSSFGGMSGVVYGLFGFVWLRGKLHPSPEFALTRDTVAKMLIWMVMCFTGVLGPIANAAHLMGLVAGGCAGTVNAFMSGGWGILKRRQQFRSSARAANATALHHCAVCGKTEHDDPSLEFYVDGDDHQEYCRAHLPERRS